MPMNNFVRICGWCQSEVTYMNEKSFRLAEKRNPKCPKCRRIGTKHSVETRRYMASLREGMCLSEETKKKISEAMKGEKSAWFGKHHSQESKEKMSLSHIGKIFTPEHCKNISKSNKGNYHTPEYKEKMSKYWKGRQFSDESKTKMRKSALHRVKKQFGTISYNKIACDFIDKLNQEKGWNLKHALNGGEKEIAGFSVDGYDEERNIVFEYDEKQHFTFNGKLRQRDIKRQDVIIKATGCEFYRYDSVRSRFYKAT